MLGRGAWLWCCVAYGQGVSAVDGRMDVTQRRDRARPPTPQGQSHATLAVVDTGDSI